MSKKILPLFLKKEVLEEKLWSMIMMSEAADKIVGFWSEQEMVFIR